MVKRVDAERRSGYRSQTRNYSSCNQETNVDVEERCGYRYQNSHYSSQNQGKRGILLTFSGDTVGGDKNMVHPLSVITMSLLQNFYTPFQIDNYNLLSL